MSTPSDDRIVAMTEQELYEMLQEVAYASHHAAQYRGQFRPDISRLEEKTINRNLSEWWDRHTDELQTIDPIRLE